MNEAKLPLPPPPADSPPGVGANTTAWREQFGPEKKDGRNLERPATIPPTDQLNNPNPAEPGEQETSDADLVRVAAKGDGRAFHALIDRHAGGLFRLAVSLCGNAADAEDVVQETLAGAYRGLSRFEGRSSVKTWLSRILVTQVALWRRGRQAKAKKTLSLSDPAGGQEADAAPSAGGDPASDVGWQMDLQAALAKLSPEHREVVALREIDGLSYDEIADLLRVPRGTVESRLHRARIELRQRLRAYLP